MNNYNFLRGNYQMDRNDSIDIFDDMNNFFPNMNMQMPNQGMMETQKLYTPEEAFTKGNLFANLYEQYKNYKPIKLVANNEQDRLYLDYARNAFAAHELNLYLDLHPNNDSMLALFNDYRRKADSLRSQYENSYGPISISSDVLVNSPFLWEEMTWPREGGNL